ncbi:hypothetical protein F511_28316 [Dorcoceras hygrometricum]|uniref:Uncharacterized protein n=1 Tax=Dorcoceras hygrometricum TaxID=472368 RepID=A0A2Z7AJU2_9LAMI|nr:hypothetical protein F511_28316 [Dorcoceras hygrometricum]
MDSTWSRAGRATAACWPGSGRALVARDAGRRWEAMRHGWALFARCLAAARCWMRDDGSRWERDGGRTMRHWLAHQASCAALVADVHGLAPRAIFVVAAAARRCSGDVVMTDFF